MEYLELDQNQQKYKPIIDYYFGHVDTFEKTK